ARQAPPRACTTVSLRRVLRPHGAAYRRGGSAACGTRSALVGETPGVCPLTIVGGGRDAPVVSRRGRRKTVCARGACQALLCGPSTSPLDRRGTHSVSDTPRFWFAATRDGRAWGWPLTWQGWLVYAVWFVGVVVLIPYLNPPQHPLFALAVVL